MVHKRRDFLITFTILCLAMCACSGFQYLGSAHRPSEEELFSVYRAAVEAMRTGNAQLAYLGPFSYVTARERAGAECLVVQGQVGTKGGYKSYIVVQADSDIQSLEDLQGKTFAFVDPESTSGNVIPTDEILSAFPDLGLTFDDLHTDGKFFKSAMFAGSHQGSLQAVAQGNVDAAAVGSSVYETRWKKAR